MEVEPTPDYDKGSPEKPEKECKASSNRASRNKNEKDRRDKVNAYINELADLVPGYSPQSKKLDKATILKNIVDYMKVHNDLTVSITCTDTISCLNSNELGQLMLEGNNGFLFVISLAGSFKFLSESVYDLLGYMKDELVEENVFDYIPPEDKLTLLNQLSYDSRTGIARNSGSSSFYLRFKRKVGDESSPETLLCCGYLKTVQEAVKSDDGSTVLSSNETCFVVLAKLLQPNYQRDVSNWLSKIDLEFSSRQTLDGKFLYLDPRCIPITGYLPYEILGSMIYEYIHFDDVENISKNFEAMLEDGEGETGNYRILTKGCQWIVIKTSSYISYNHWNSKPEFICSTHQLVRKHTIHTNRERKIDVSIADSRPLPASRSVQVDEISSAGSSPMRKNEDFDDGHNVSSSELTTLNTFSITNQASHTPTSITQSFQKANTPINPAQMATSFVKTNRGSADTFQTAPQQNSQTFPTSSLSKIEIARRENLESGRSDPSVPLRSGAVGKNRQSPGAGFWSGQDVSSNKTGATFHNPLAVIQQPQLSSRSSSRVSSPSPQAHKTTPDGYFSSLLLSQTSPQSSPRMMEGYQSTTQYPVLSSQPSFGDKYRHAPSPLSPASPHPSSPYSVPPHSPANSNVSCQSPNPNHYTALSPSLAPAYHHSPSSPYHIPPGTNEVYPPMSPYPPLSMNERRVLQGSHPMSPQSTTSYPQAPYDYPVRSPQTPTVSLPEIYRQPAVSPHPIQQNTINHPRLPESNLLPFVRQNVLNEQSMTAARSSPLTSSVIDNLTQFPLQLEQQHMASIYPYKFSNTPARSPAEPFDRNYQSTEQFSTGEKKIRSQGMEMFSPSRTSECAMEYDRTPNINHDRPTSEQLKHNPKQYLGERGDETLTQGKTFNARLQNSAVDAMVPPQNLNYTKAQRILRDQLLEKQTHLQNVIQNQKAQLSRIQGEVIFNAKAQFSLHEISDLESTKQLQQQVHDLESERRQQEARQRELKSIFIQKFNGLDGEALQDNRPTSSTQGLREEEDIFSGVLQPDRGQTSLSDHYYTPVVNPQSIPHNKTPSSTSQPDSSDLSFEEQNSTTDASSTSAASSSQVNDYFSQFSERELGTFFSTPSFPSAIASPSAQCSDNTDDNTLSDDNCGKEETTSPSSYDSLLLQQKRLLEMQEEQRVELVRQQQEQLLRLQRHQETVLRELQNTSENTQQDNELEPQIPSQGQGGAVAPEDTSSVLPHELSDEDQSIVNMLLAEEIGTELWTDDIFGMLDRSMPSAI